MDFPRIVIGYHGCLEPVASRLISGELAIAAWPRSENTWDWLGRGIYFWEHAPDRALDWARARAKRERTRAGAAVVGALVDLGRCLDLTETTNTAALERAYSDLRSEYEAVGRQLPRNTGTDRDRRRRELDCLVVNYCLEVSSVGYGTVRVAFVEGRPIYPGAKLHRETHVQIAVRDPSCIVGVFRPNL